MCGLSSISRRQSMHVQYFIQTLHGYSPYGKTGSMQCVPYSVVVNYGKYRKRPLPQKRENVSYNCHVMSCYVTYCNEEYLDTADQRQAARDEMPYGVLHPSVYSKT